MGNVAKKEILSKINNNHPSCQIPLIYEKKSANEVENLLRTFHFFVIFKLPIKYKGYIGYEKESAEMFCQTSLKTSYIILCVKSSVSLEMAFDSTAEFVTLHSRYSRSLI